MVVEAFAGWLIAHVAVAQLNIHLPFVQANQKPLSIALADGF